MVKKECVAMVLAGGKGSRLARLTSSIPKPAVPFGGSHRLIDFSLSNCFNSHIDTIGLLTAKRPFTLSMKQKDANVHILPPRGEISHYKGTANAVYENIDFIDKFEPDYVLVLSGDHIYKMDYSLLLQYHKAKDADVTISVVQVSRAEASRFGIMTLRFDGSIADFAEKPVRPRCNLASMGVYVFSWRKLKQYLLMDEGNHFSNHDFGKNIIPAMLRNGEKVYAYRFNGYWRDVGVVESLYDAHMDLLASPSLFCSQGEWPIYSTLTDLPLVEVVRNGKARSMISRNSLIHGDVVNSVIYPGVYIGKNAVVKDSVVMPGVYIGHAAYVDRAIIGPGAAIENGYAVLASSDGAVAVVAENSVAAPVMRCIGDGLENGYYQEPGRSEERRAAAIVEINH